MGKKKPKICPYCKKPIKQGHRKDRCEKLKWSKTYGISNNKIYFPSKYKNKKFERIECHNAVTLMMSGANVIPDVQSEAVVSDVKYMQSLVSVRDEMQKRIDERTNKKTKKKLKP
jgi:hypothetical protein